MLFQRSDGLYTGVSGLGPFGDEVFPEKFRLPVAEEILGGQNRRKHRNAGIQLHAHKTVDHSAGDKFVPVYAAIDDQTTGNNPRILTTAGEDFRAQGNFEGAGHFEQIDVAVIQLCMSS